MERIHARRTRCTIPTISVDKDKFVNVNPAAMDLVGMSLGDIYGSTISRLRDNGFDLPHRTLGTDWITHGHERLPSEGS